MAKGKKNCPNCKEEVGARVLQCNCKYHFFQKKILLEMIYVPIEKKDYSSEGKGRKKCPQCTNIVGVRTIVCPKCNYNFFSAKEEIVVIKEEQKKVDKPLKHLNPIIEQLKQEQEQKQEQENCDIQIIEDVKNLSPDEHIDRIMKLSKERILNLINMSKDNKWGHVNWNKIKSRYEEMYCNNLITI
jgi:RNA polymerase subunit RPABC4/transcription elongation factor Spt4